jgi:hypothetical protein
LISTTGNNRPASNAVCSEADLPVTGKTATGRSRPLRPVFFLTADFSIFNGTRDVPSHSERVRRNDDSGWWTQWQARRRAERDAPVADDSAAVIATARERRNAVASQPVTSDSTAGTDRDGAQ